MKTKILIALAIMVSMAGFAQKNEIKAAEKALNRVMLLLLKVH